MGEYSNIEWNGHLIVCQICISRAVERIIKEGNGNDSFVMKDLMALKDEGYVMYIVPLAKSRDVSNKLWWGIEKEITILNPEVREDIKEILAKDDNFFGYHKEAYDQISQYVASGDIEVTVNVEHPWADLYKNFTIKLVSREI